MIVDAASEKFELAVFGLAAGTSPLQVRLIDAYTEHIAHLTPDDLPEYLREDFIKLAELLKAISYLPRSDSPEAKKAILSDGDAMVLARMVMW